MYAIKAAGKDELKLFLLQLSFFVKSLFEWVIPNKDGSINSVIKCINQINIKHGTATISFAKPALLTHHKHSIAQQQLAVFPKAPENGVVNQIHHCSAP